LTSVGATEKLAAKMPIRRISIFLVFVLTLVFAASAHAYVYWADYQGGTIGRANLDGTGVNDGFIQTGGHPNAVAVDSSHIYWSNETAGTIGRANLDGSGVNPTFISGIKKPFGVAVNSSAIFWASLESKAIGRANLDGSAPNFGLVTNAGTAICSIAIDNGHIYWGNSGLTSYIGRSSLTGNSSDPTWVNLETYVPCGVAVNSANVFFANTGFLGGHAHEIGRININGIGQPDESIIGEAEGPCGLAVFGSQLYWANQGTDTIGVANTDATGVNESLVVTGGNEICGVAVDSGYTPITTPSGTGGGSTASPSPAPSSPPLAGTVKVVKVKNDKKKGTARVSIAVNEAGSVAVSGKGAVTAKATAKGGETVMVTAKAAKSKQASLEKTGRLQLKLAIKFTPSNGGAAASATKSITLRRQPGSTPAAS
jgi:virginiamycin B lyase